ncbi:hypothetical protein AXE80_06525 [Wenyingzhuangia fucanilytica]|uniref:DUF8202 domain-containing protein n=1 Tax=Wenyingzhuangia fucanilytica TaxID=1790137 RepID=A0A1B1Y5C5_9FLAO|nr:LamG-like jellyroll fold domain-containing protein [Wenyingzhuangia fucanilytica]ANW95954.1 hypothetical protein AXE80_06525 [Wenyingzhuangia fucanilytica]
MINIFLKQKFFLFFLLIGFSYNLFSQTPGGVPGTILWLKADAGTNTTTNGEGITSWTDQSGNGFNATGTGDAVYSTVNAINGNPVIYFTDDDQPITGTTVIRGEGPNSSTDKSTSFIVQRKSSTSDDCFIEFYEGSSRQFYIDRRYDANEPFFTLPTGIQQIISVSDPGGSGSGADSNIYLNSNHFFTSENLFSTSWENGSYVIGDDSTGGNQLNGEIAEIIYFDYELTEANRKKIESYLAVKYGITLDNTDGGTDGDYVTSTGVNIWDASANATYHHEVIGIGRDDSSLLDQQKSTEFNSDPTLTIDKTSSFSNNLDYLIVGNDEGTLAFSTSGVPASITNKSQRTWKTEISGTPGTISISFTLGTSLTNSGNPSEYALLIDSDTDFTSGATIHTTGASINGNVLTFTNVNLSDGNFFTLAYTPIDEFPGNISSGLTHWFKADTGITTDGNGITTWEDQATTDGSDDATRDGGVSADYPIVQSNKHNYNSSVYFANGNNGYLDFDLSDIKDSDYNIIGIIERTNTNDHNYFIGTTSTTTNQGLRIGYRNNNSNPRYLFQQQGTSVSNSFDDYNASTEKATLIRGTLDNGVEQTISALMNGNEVSNTDASDTDFLTGAAPGVLGRGNRSDRGFQGYVSEVIIYNSALSTLDLSKIESYLAIKYALTLDNSGGGTDGDYVDSASNTLWDASENATYHNEIIGIGRDDTSTLNQFKSSEPISSTNLTIEKTGSFSNNQDFLIIGNDNGTIGLTTTGISPVYSERIERTWKAAVSGSVGGVTISITLPATSTGNTGDYALLIDSDTDFSDSNIHTTGVSLDGDVVTFTNVNLSDGDVFTLGIGLSFGPANVTSGLTHWFRADDGTSTTSDGVAITQWDNLTGSNNATQAGASDYPTYKENLHNFNPSVYISNGDNGYFDVNLNGINDSDYNIISIVERELTEDENYILGTTATTSNQGLHFGYRNNSSLTLAQYGNDIDVTVNNYNDPAVSRALIRGQLDSSSGKIIQELRDGSFSENSHGTTSFLTGDNSGVLGRGYGTNGFKGYVSELIIYNSTLSNTDLAKIFSYLAIKYGMTLSASDGVTNGDYLDSNGNVLWDASENSTYHHDVAGIGYDVASNLIQKQSKSASSDDILSVSIYSSVTATNNLNLGAFDDNLDYLIWGNNGTTSSISLETHVSSENACLKQLDRDWKISNNGNISNVTLQFDLSSFTSRDFSLIIDLDGDGDYTTGTIETISTGTITGDNIVYTNVTLPNDCVFTLVDNSSDIVYQVGAWVGGAGTGEEFDNSATDLVKSVEIKEDVTLSDDANCKCLKISNGAKVTVQANDILTVTHTLNSNGFIYLYENAQLVQTNATDTNSGIGKVYQILNEATDSGYRFNYLSSPVQTSGTYDLATHLKFNTNALNIEENTTPTFMDNDSDGFGTTISSKWFYTFPNTLNFVKIDENTDINAGLGFTMKGTNQANRYNFMGTPNNGDITPISITTNNYVLLGNPYPSALDIDAFNTAMLSGNITDGVVYLWDQPTGDSHYQTQYDGGYATRANGVSAPAAGVTNATTPTNVLKPMQGFLVAGGTTGGNITFTNSMRLTNTSTSGEKFYRTSKVKNVLKPVVRLGFEFTENDKTFHRQLVAVANGGSLEVELGKDAYMFDYFANDAYWVLPNDPYRFVINDVPVPDESLSLDLGVVVDQTREITFKLDDVEGLSTELYLLDKEEETLTNIKEEVYKTTVTSGEYTNRFSLVFKEDQNLDSEHHNLSKNTVIYVDEANKEISVVAENKSINSVSVYSMSGELLATANNKTKSNSLVVSLKNASSQIYLVKVVTNNGTFSQKVFFK